MKLEHTDLEHTDIVIQFWDNLDYYIKNNIFYKLKYWSYTFKTKGGLL